MDGLAVDALLEVGLALVGKVLDGTGRMLVCELLIMVVDKAATKLRVLLNSGRPMVVKGEAACEKLMKPSSPRKHGA